MGAAGMQMIRAADEKTRPQVLEILDSAKDLGLKVLRIWAFSEGPIQYNTLQRYPGNRLPACLPACLPARSPFDNPAHHHKYSSNQVVGLLCIQLCRQRLQPS